MNLVPGLYRNHPSLKRNQAADPVAPVTIHQEKDRLAVQEVPVMNPTVGRGDLAAPVMSVHQNPGEDLEAEVPTHRNTEEVRKVKFQEGHHDRKAGLLSEVQKVQRIVALKSHQKRKNMLML